MIRSIVWAGAVMKNVVNSRIIVAKNTHDDLIKKFLLRQTQLKFKKKVGRFLTLETKQIQPVGDISRVKTSKKSMYNGIHKARYSQAFKGS
jgi:hypothetical protein